MKLKVHRPRLLIAMLLLIGVLTTSAILLADGGDEVIKTRFIPFPVPPTKVPLTEEQIQDAERIVKLSDVVELISGGQEWDVARIRRDKIDGHEAVAMTVEWERPVDSSGPWIVPHCDGTRQMFSSRGFSGIKQLVISVDVEDREVLAYSVTGEPGEDPVMAPRDPNVSLKFYDFKTGELVFDGEPGEVPSLKKICPPGWQPRYR